MKREKVLTMCYYIKALFNAVSREFRLTAQFFQIYQL